MKVRGQEKVRRSEREGLGVRRRKSRSREKVWESGGGHRVRRRRSGVRRKRYGGQKVRSQEEKVRESWSEVGEDIQEETGGKN